MNVCMYISRSHNTLKYLLTSRTFFNDFNAILAYTNALYARYKPLYGARRTLNFMPRLDHFA